MNKGKELRLRRILGTGPGKSVIIPMDHPVIFGAMPGVADARGLVQDAVKGNVDSVLLTLATLGRVADVMGHMGSIARIDGCSTKLGSHMTEVDRFHSVELAVAAGADACVLNIYVGVDNERDLLRKLGETAEACQKWGLPLVAEMIPGGVLGQHYGAGPTSLSEEEVTDQIALACRVGAEMGADVIKTAYSGSAESFKKVVDAAAIPVVVAGGPCGESVQDLMHMVEDCITAGAVGVCMGRNVWQRENRLELMKAIGRIVHDGVPADKALE